MKNLDPIERCFLGAILAVVALAAADFLPAPKSADTIDFEARLARCGSLAHKADGNLEVADVAQMIEDCLDDNVAIEDLYVR